MSIRRECVYVRRPLIDINMSELRKKVYQASRHQNQALGIIAKVVGFLLKKCGNANVSVFT